MEPFEKPDTSVHDTRRKGILKGAVERRKPVPRVKPNKMNMKWKKPSADYSVLNTAAIVRCRIPHPNPYMGTVGKGIEYHLREVPWSDSQYVDIRKYHTRSGFYGKGIMLHYDVMKALMPHLLTLMRTLEANETRDPEYIRKVVVLDGPKTPDSPDIVPPVLGH